MNDSVKLSGAEFKAFCANPDVFPEERGHVFLDNLAYRVDGDSRTGYGDDPAVARIADNAVVEVERGRHVTDCDGMVFAAELTGVIRHWLSARREARMTISVPAWKAPHIRQIIESMGGSVVISA